MMEELYTATCKNGDTYDFYFPKMNIKGKEIVRYFSMMNPWIDVVVVVDPQYAEKARTVLEEAIDEYWDSDALCYGDLIDIYFKEAGIPYLAVYHDPDDERSQYEEAWERYLKALYEQKGEK